MVQIIIATATSRNTFIVEDTMTYAELFAREGLDTVGMTYHRDGTVITDLNAPISSNCMVVAVPAQKAGLN